MIAFWLLKGLHFKFMNFPKFLAQAGRLPSPEPCRILQVANSHLAFVPLFSLSTAPQGPCPLLAFLYTWQPQPGRRLVLRRSLPNCPPKPPSPTPLRPPSTTSLL